ncbi:MAG: coproporphyrinogen dehydrogenase HemZ [Clostridia bacterium]|nr:coproporphyrinogen dehydrogenase HemZ [Clostridia bacterium]
MTTVRLTCAFEYLRQELNDVVRLFLGDVPISESEGALHITHTHEAAGGVWIERVTDGKSVYARKTPAARGELEEKRAVKRAAKTALFLLMRDRSGINPPWGSLTGIRPTRLMYEAMEAGLSAGEAEARMREEFYVSAEKASLLREIIEMQRGLIDPPENTFDLYIGIPFCVTRCAYCSFSSGEIGNGRLTEPYTDALIREIRGSAEIMREKGLSLRAAYVGGGTPTALSCTQLGRILDAAMECFPNAAEWTVEAGRPDTIDREKLLMLKTRGVGRISVNPQTFSDATLKLIGRAHTSGDTLRAYGLARETGFDHINMDIIAALPGEDMDMFTRTLDRVTELAPESVTVHSLAIKRSSKLHEALTVAGDSHNQADAAYAADMISAARGTLESGGWRPYYLYRQKYMAGNLENVGYAKPGYACLYNIGNMEETACVLAVGAGSISKWLFPREKRIERAANLKNIEEYISRADEMIARKRELILKD